MFASFLLVAPAAVTDSNNKYHYTSQVCHPLCHPSWASLQHRHLLCHRSQVNHAWLCHPNQANLQTCLNLCHLGDFCVCYPSQVSHHLCHLLSCAAIRVRRAFSITIRLSQVSLQHHHPAQPKSEPSALPSGSVRWPSALPSESVWQAFSIAICCAIEVKRAISCSVGYAK
jgi:hypothetical protein